MGFKMKIPLNLLVELAIVTWLQYNYEINLLQKIPSNHL